jgi:regulator of protease activity HflC (stomatin/prohibitin superfamily)
MAESNEDTPGQSAWQRWNDELELSRKAKGFDQWHKRSERIVKRYRAERPDVSENSDNLEGARFNILWSNVQTLLPALFAKAPKPVVERRYLDRDEVGRTASVILERTLSYELDDGTYLSGLKKGVLDRLLPGRGVVWIRYEPKFTPMPGKTQEAASEAPIAAGATSQERVGASVADDRPEAGPQEVTSDAPIEQVADESVVVDYIDWRDFMTSPARTWEEVWWVGKRVYMTREELVKRFGPVGKEVTLDWSPVETSSSARGQISEGDTKQRRAKVWEIWNKQVRRVYWMAESYKERLLDEKDDPLGLESFWPVPKPLFATLTNDSLIPVPDYVEYEDQAQELDDLTTRITNLVKTIKACGVYDASVSELQRMFKEGFENELVPCDNMAEFSSKAGANGMGHIWMLPIKDMAETLIQLYDARERTKQVLYEVTGISDIVRGASQGGAKTATEQRIKGQFASMRLNDMQAEVARFARDTLRIMGEIIAEHFDPMTLFEISGFEQYAKEQWPPEVPDAPPMAPMMGHNGGPPLDQPAPAAIAPPSAVGAPVPGPASSSGGGQMPMGMMAPPPDPQMLAMQKAADMFKKAVALLRNDKLRGFRIDIETDSIIEPDQQQMQQARTELMGAISQFLPQAVAAGAQSPELKPLLARLLMFFLRGFKASRDIESAFEQFIDDMTRDAAKPKPPPPPTPDQIKAEMMREQQANENKRMEAQALMDQQNFEREQQAKQMDAQLAQQQAQQQFELEQQKQAAEIQAMADKQAIERERMEMELAFEERKLALQERAQAHAASIKAATAEHSAAMKAKTDEKKAKAPVNGANA